MAAYDEPLSERFRRKLPPNIGALGFGNTAGRAAAVPAHPEADVGFGTPRAVLQPSVDYGREYLTRPSLDRSTPSQTSAAGAAGTGESAPSATTMEVSRKGTEFTGKGPISGYSGDWSGALAQPGGTGKRGGSMVVSPAFFTGGPSLPLSRELSEARQAAADRGDWKAVDWSYMNPEEQAATMQVSEPYAGSMTIPELAAYGAQRRERSATAREQRAQKGALALEGLRGQSALALLERQHKLGKIMTPEETALAQARTRLYGAQAGAEEARVGEMQDRKYLEEKIAGSKDKAEKDRWTNLYAMKYGSRGDKATTAAEIYNKLALAGMPDVEARQYAGFAGGGYVERYADGGAITAPITRTQQVNPAVAQYGQYLSAAASAGVPPVPFNQYMNLLQTTRDAMQETPAQFANGGMVGDDEEKLKYQQPSTVGWGGVLSRGLSRLGIGDTAPAASAVPATQPATMAGGSEEIYNPWKLSPEQEEEARVRGYADGGDVSALRRPIRGPGTGRSDSIPATINGQQPAALSDGEFVIPAHVVRAKGTEFFEKLIGQYDQGQK